MVKTLLNSLYGKFGQKSEVWEAIEEVEVIDDSINFIVNADTGKRQSVRHMGKLSEVKLGSEESFDSFPAISACVTANARDYLWGLMLKVGLENIWYCDTDSLFVNQVGFERLQDEINPNEIGKLKVEKTTTHLEIRAPKSYTFGEEKRLKGVKKDAVRVADNVYEQWQFQGLNGAQRKRTLDHQLLIKQRKVMSNAVKKGDLQGDGKILPKILGNTPQTP
jgi:hypothetical protein